MTGLHMGKQGAQHPKTDSSVEGGVNGALTTNTPMTTRCGRTHALAVLRLRACEWLCFLLENGS